MEWGDVARPCFKMRFGQTLEATELVMHLSEEFPGREISHYKRLDAEYSFLAFCSGSRKETSSVEEGMREGERNKR